MGSPLGPTLANIFLCFHEKQWLSRTPGHFAPIIYRRYVDDIFTVFANEDQADQFLSYINSQHPNLNFTLEKESSNKLAFLDILVSKRERNIELSVYRKPTTTELGTNYFSFTPLKFKVNAIKTLIHRAYSVCSSYKIFDSEVAFLRKFFTSNAYPARLFEREVCKFLNARYKPLVTFTTVPKLIHYLVFPFSGYSSHKLEKEIKEIVFKYYPQLNLKIIFTNKSTIGSFFKHKESTLSQLCSSVVYKFECERCNSSYVGSTVRHLKARVDEHRGVSSRTGQFLTKPSHSEIRNHCHTNNHPLNSKHFSIIDRCNSPYDLRLLESIHIHKLRPSLNSYQSAAELCVLK